MNLLAKPNIFIFKITEPTCSYSDKHKGEKNSLETCASHSVTESESFTIAGPGFSRYGLLCRHWPWGERSPG